MPISGWSSNTRAPAKPRWRATVSSPSDVKRRAPRPGAMRTGTGAVSLQGRGLRILRGPIVGVALTLLVGTVAPAQQPGQGGLGGLVPRLQPGQGVSIGQVGPGQPLDTATARMLGLPTAPTRTFPDADSVLTELLKRTGYKVTRYKADSATYYADERRM